MIKLKTIIIVVVVAAAVGGCFHKPILSVLLQNIHWSPLSNRLL